jgi:drug/metabolite transporter (DMT)-like permease
MHGVAPMRFAGETAALGTAACFSLAANLFAAAGKKIGSTTVNRIRLAAVVPMLSVALMLTKGAAWPFWATGLQLSVLALSGLVGLVFGDGNYYRSLVILGPGRASLLAATSPIFTMTLAWVALGERPGRLALLGVALTAAGVILVVYKKQPSAAAAASMTGSVAAGVLAGVLGALGQAGGLILSKVALRSGIDPLSATVIRAAAGCAGVWTLTLLRGETSKTFRALRDRRTAGLVFGGTLAGPLFGVGLSLLAIRLIEAGVTASIIAIAPIPTMILARWLHKEPLTLRGVMGALIAVSGVIVLFMR